jgi:hypothetical protein
MFRHLSICEKLKDIQMKFKIKLVKEYILEILVIINLKNCNHPIQLPKKHRKLKYTYYMEMDVGEPGRED